MYALLEMKTGLMETEFRLGFSRLIRVICKSAGITCGSIVQTWTRTSIKNDVELAQICRDSVGIVSQKTILKNHPLVEDADAELKQLEKEQAAEQQREEQYGRAFDKAQDEAQDEEAEKESKKKDSEVTDE